MKAQLLAFIFLCFSPGLFAQTTISATAVRLYQSETNDPAHLSNSYDTGFSVGSYSKNYALVAVVYFDVSSFSVAQLQAASFSISAKLTSINSAPNNLNIDYIGAFDDTANSLARYLSAPVETFSNVLTYSATSGATYNFDVSSVANHASAAGFAAFRFYQTGYLVSDSTTRQYNFSSALTDTKLSITPIPEPGTIVLYASLAVGAFVLFKRRR